MSRSLAIALAALMFCWSYTAAQPPPYCQPVPFYCQPLPIAPKPAKSEMATLIDQLADLSMNDIGFSASLHGRVFTPLYSRGRLGVVLLYQPQPNHSEPMRRLVVAGAAAMPDLLAHLDDKRKTKIVISDEGGTFRYFFADSIDRNTRTEKPANEHQGSDDVDRRMRGEYALTVGDLCFVAIGQIVNRNFDTVTDFSPRGILLSSPTQSAVLREQVKDAWDGLTRNRHVASLVADFLKPDSEERRIGACNRLAYYYPDALEPLALKVLSEPTKSEAGIDVLSQKQLVDLIHRAFVYDQLSSIDRAIRDLLVKSNGNDRLAEACIQRLRGRGYDAEIEAYCKDRLARRPDDTYQVQEIRAKIGWTRLHTAIEREDKDTFDRLLHDKVKVDVATRDGTTPLHLAAAMGELEAVKMLVAAGAAVNRKNGEGLLPVQLAVRNDGLEIVRYLVEHGSAIPDAQVAVGAGRADLADKLLKADPASLELTTSGRRESLVHLAGRSGNTATVDMLASRGAKMERLDDAGQTPLHYAVQTGNEPMVRSLIRAKAMVDAEVGGNSGIKPLHLAVETGNVKIASLLLDAKADINARITSTGQTPLMLAVARGDAKMVELLLARRAKVRLTDQNRMTALHYGATKAAMVKLLLAEGADPLARDHEERTPLDLAYEAERRDCIRLLEAAILHVTNVFLTNGPVDGPRDSNAVLPGDTIHVRLHIENLAKDKDGEALYERTAELTDASGKVVCHEDGGPSRAKFKCGRSPVTISVPLTISRDFQPGMYTWKVVVTDRITGARDTAETHIVVRKPEFGMILPRLWMGDPAEKLPAGPTAMVGQTLAATFTVVDFCRDENTGKPNVECSMRILNADGTPVLPKPRIVEFGAKVGADQERIDVSFPIDLNRAGEFTIELTVRDKVMGQERGIFLPLKVAGRK